MKGKKIYLYGGVALTVLISGILIATGFANNENKGTSFITVPVEKRDLGALVQATGIIKPKVGAEVKVGARITGKVEHLYANIGDRVRKGQVLVQLEQDDLRARVEQAAASHEETQAAYDKAKADLNRDRELSEKGYITAQAFDNLQNAHDMAKARLSRAKADLDYARTQLSYATIKAPIQGTIASVTTQEGETVAAGLSAPTFITIIDLSKLEVNAYIDETDVGKINEGQEAIFTVDTFPDKDFKGRVRAIYPRAVLQENVVNYITLISIANTEGKLKPDMTANVTVTLKKKTGVLAVPSTAVRRDGGKKFLMVLAQDGTHARREVKTGWKDGAYLEITSGVKEGEVVIASEGDLKK